MSEFQKRDEIVWRLHLVSCPERVFEALSTDQGRGAFWAEKTIEENGAIRFQFIHGEAGPCPILEVEPNRLFVLEYFGHYVRFELDPDDEGGTDLTLTTHGFSAEDRDHVLAGWLNVLFPLKGYLDFGVDLRNHDRRRSWMQHYVDQ